MRVVKCDVCGTTSDERLPYPDQFSWRSLTVRAKSGWMPSMVSAMPGTNMVQESVDSWPGYSRWWSGHTISLHVCSESCMFDALAKLHEGATVTGFDGFGVPTERMLEWMREPERDPA